MLIGDSIVTQLHDRVLSRKVARVVEKRNSLHGTCKFLEEVCHLVKEDAPAEFILIVLGFKDANLCTDRMPGQFSRILERLASVTPHADIIVCPTLRSDDVTFSENVNMAMFLPKIGSRGVRVITNRIG